MSPETLHSNSAYTRCESGKKTGEDRRYWAELTSTVGAGLLGAGLGILWSSWLSGRAGALLAVGVLLHGWGMFDRYRLNRFERPAGAAAPWWSSLLYTVCWVALAVLAVLIFTKR